MYIRVEPREFMMQWVYLYFDQDAPNAEDEEVRNFLAERGLVPKEQINTEIEGRQNEILSFGGCYLGRHLGTIVEIQRNVVKREVLAEEISRMLRDGPNVEANARVSSMREDQLAPVLDRLVDEYLRDSSFGVDGEGEHRVVLDASDVQASFLLATA